MTDPDRPHSRSDSQEKKTDYVAASPAVSANRQESYTEDSVLGLAMTGELV
jgi:hypothetical protein